MSSRITLFGATGYTGQLTAVSLARRGTKNVVLAGRNAERLADLAASLKKDHGISYETAVADVGQPKSVSDLVAGSDDVLISTVGPFVKFGAPAIEAAVTKGAIYLDSTGEPPFIRRVFEKYGPRAERTGAALLTAFGYDYVPGNLAGVLALNAAQAKDASVDKLEIGYFISTTGKPGRTLSGGTAASSLGILAEPGFAWQGGKIRTERPAARVRDFEVSDRKRSGISIGGTEHFALPRLDADLRDVDVFLGWAGSRSGQLSTLRQLVDPLTKVPMLTDLVSSVASRFVSGSSGGPDADDRHLMRTVAVAEAYSGDQQVARVAVSGPSPYDLTADLLAWGAERAAAGELGTAGKRRKGALGPADAFGTEAFIEGCDTLGLSQDDVLIG